MEFKHSDERQMLVDTLARYLKNEYPLSARNAAAVSAEGFDTGQWQTLADLGIFGAFFSEDQGGFGGSAYDVIAVFEELGRALVVEPLLDCALLPGQLLAAVGDLDRLSEVIEGSTRITVAMDQGDHQIAALRPTPTDGYWIITGDVPMVKFAKGADAIIVAAQTAEDPAQVSLFMVPEDQAGVVYTHHQTFDGGSVSDLHFDNVRLCENAMIGPLNGAGTLVKTAKQWAILAICAEALGIMEAIKTTTLEYLRTRTQFGTVIGRFQALQHRMAQLLLEIEQARSAVINAAAAMTSDLNQRQRAVSAAKFSIGRIGTLVAEDSIQLHGGIGMTWEYDMGHFAKRLMMIDHELGDADHHLALFMQTELA